MDSFVSKLTAQELEILTKLKSAELLNAFTQQDDSISELKKKESSYRTRELFSIEKIISENKLSSKSRLVRFILFSLRKFEQFGPEALSGINMKIMRGLAPGLVQGVINRYKENTDIYSEKTLNEVLSYVNRFFDNASQPSEYMKDFYK